MFVRSIRSRLNNLKVIPNEMECGEYFLVWFLSHCSSSEFGVEHEFGAKLGKRKKYADWKFFGIKKITTVWKKTEGEQSTTPNRNNKFIVRYFFVL